MASDRPSPKLPVANNFSRTITISEKFFELI